MKFSFFICAILAVTFGDEVTSQAVSCEKIANYDWPFIGEGLVTLKTCHMDETTTIASDEFVVSPPDSTIEAIDFVKNKKIQFLPVRVHETFPQLVVYPAVECSIKKVSKKNFKNLKKLTHIFLVGNQIEQIDSNVFEDLTSLKVLHLEYNKIKRINGAAFGGLVKLAEVYLSGNVCIDDDYTTPTKIAFLGTEVTEKCGFSEVEEENSENVLQGKQESTAEKKVTEMAEQ